MEGKTKKDSYLPIWRRRRRRRSIRRSILPPMKKTRKLLEPYPLSISHGQMKPRLGSVFAANMMVFFVSWPSIMNSWKFLSPSLPPLLVMAKQELITPAGRSCCRRRSLVFSFFFLCEFLLFLISFSSFLLLCHRRLILYCFCILYDWCFCNQTACKPKIAAAEGHCVKNRFCNSCSFWFVWRKHCLFLKSRHLPSGLCGQNLSVSQISSSSFWFVWGKPVCFSSLVLFLLVCVKETVSVSQLPSEVSFYNSDWRNQVCLGVMISSSSSSSSWCSCWKDVRVFVRVLKDFWQLWLFLNYWTILPACNNRSREVVPEEGSGLLGSTPSSSNQYWSILG